MIRYAKLMIPFNLREMQNELLQVREHWQAHFNTYYYEGSWTALALRSPGGSDKNIVPDLVANADYLDTELMKLFPSVAELTGRLNCAIKSVRFLSLQPGAIIKQHRDNELAFEKGEARLHFTVTTNSGVKFFIENDQIPFNDGDCWYMNANLPHRVANEGVTERIHLVIDCTVNNWLSDIINSAETISHKANMKSSDMAGIIRELRLQNTPTSNKLASEMEQALALQMQQENTHP